MAWRRSIVLLSIAITGLTCAQPDRRVPERGARLLAAAGCYRLKALDSSAEGFGVLDEFELVADTAGPGRTSTQSLRLPGMRSKDDSTRFIFHGWGTDAATDSIRVWAGNGFGTRLFVGVLQGHDLVGRAWQSSDAGPPFTFDVRSARAIREPCKPQPSRPAA